MGLLLLALLTLCAPAGSAEQRSEAEIKAAFLFYFARFVDWPEDAFFSPDSPLVIAILDDPELFDAASRTISHKSVDHHPVQVRAVDHIGDAERSHILFIGRRRAPELAAIRAALADSHVFAVSDVEGYANDGGTAHFFVEGGRVRFAINSAVAKARGLSVSSQLLRVAEAVP